ncbi:hypothetical protein [Pygmaiobacter massiliensis]|uniref:hypothetical protein n=1 Tax=Pygmaiobacter massiliensis TaxID=1917873 RepID=UPI00289ABB3E|nr:hypothetical protein [Pygmaiobacter massiliensis]
MDEYLNFLEKLFPSIDPYVAERVEDSMRQFYRDSADSYSCFYKASFEFLAQGDIIAKLPFLIVHEDGTVYTERYPAIILSNTCDVENDEYIVASPLFNLSSFDFNPGRIGSIKKNKTNNLLYFPDKNFENQFINLNIVNTYKKSSLVSAWKEKKINRVASLNQFGYFLFLTKMTVNYMRPENKEVYENRCSISKG